MSAPAIPPGDLGERIVAALRAARKPVTFKGLQSLVNAKAKAKDDAFRVALESAVGEGQVHRWRITPPYFWHHAPEQKAREAILTVAASHAFKKTDLSKAAAKHLHGLPVKRVEAQVAALVSEKELRAVTPFSGRSKLLVRAGGHQAYFDAARSFVEQRIRSAGFDPSAFFTANSSPPDQPTIAQVDAAGLILGAVQSLEPVRGVPVSTLRLRNHLPALTKHEFDGAALELRKNQKVFLSQHADPYNLSEEDKNLLIDGQDGTYYVAIAIR